MAALPIPAVGANDEEIESFISTLPSTKGLFPDTKAYRYGGEWVYKPNLVGILMAQKEFRPQPDSVILATYPKCGTTWFAALLFTTINRTQYDFVTHPLLDFSPHECVPWIEYYVQGDPPRAKIPNSSRPTFKTHIPYSLLPDSILKCSDCPIVYVARNPLDAFVSLWHFVNTIRPKDQPLDIDELFDMFCLGNVATGSYWDHVLSYWNASLEMPDKFIFVKFEDMKARPIDVLKKVAKFIGCPFSLEEEQNGVIERIIEFCSFESLTSFKVNTDATEEIITIPGMVKIAKTSFYRKGKVGDHKTYLTDEMVSHLKEITNMKFKGSGLELLA